MFFEKVVFDVVGGRYGKELGSLFLHYLRYLLVIRYKYILAKE